LARCASHHGPKSVLLILLVLLAAPAGLRAEDRIEWAPVEGADHYRVEIRQAGDLVLETRSDAPSLPLFLPVGEYEFRVKVINTFGKVAATGEWSPVTVRAPKTPFIIDFEPREIHEGETPVYRSRISGYAAPGELGEGREGTTFLLADVEGKEIELTPRGAEAAASSDDGWRQIVLDPGRREPGEGSWTLVMTNPDGRTNRMENALTVLERRRPRIRRFEPDSIAAGKAHNPAELSIAGLEDGAEVVFDGPSPLNPTLLADDGEGTLRYTLDLVSAAPGDYAIVVTNPSGGSDRKEKAFEITPRPPTPEEIAEANALKIDEREPRAIPDYPRAVVGGWNFSFHTGESRSFYGNDFAGLSVSYQQEVRNDLIRRIPGLDGLGWNVGVVYSHNRTSYPLYDIRNNRFHFLLGVHYVTPFDFPVNLLLRAASGIGFSIYTSPERNRDQDIGTGELRDLDSADFVARFGIGGRYEINPRWFVDVSCDIGATFYLSRSAWALQPRIEGGWRW